MNDDPDLKLWEKIATPTRFANTVSKEYMGRQYRPYPWLLHVERKVLDAIADPEERFIILNVPPQSGKALEVTTPIPTPDGWKAIGDLRAGDVVYGHDGQEQTVAVAHDPYEAELWRVTFDDRSEILCDGDHLWTVASKVASECYAATHEAWGDGWPSWRAAGKGKRPGSTPIGQTMTTAATRELARSTTVRGDSRPNWRIPLGRIEGRDADLPIDPYLLGYWLGDGTSTSGTITIGRPDLGFFQEAHPDVKVKEYAPGVFTVRVRGLTAALRDAGVLGNKHIPDVYLRASREQRLALLRGLMDSDGGMSGNAAEIAQQSKRIAAAVSELVISLGGKVRTVERPARLHGRATGATVYRQSVLSAFNPFRLHRKADRWAENARRQRRLVRTQRVIRSITPTGVFATVRCITVDSPDGLYLAGESMIPTHNTTFSGMFLPAWYLGMYPHHQVIFVAYAQEYAETWGAKARGLIDRYGRKLFGVGLSKSQSSINNWKMDNGFGGMMSVGIGGGITGNPGHLVIIDDVIKTMEEAASPTTKKKHLAEYDGAISSRFQEREEQPDGTVSPGTTVLVTATRFADDDLSGSLIERMDKMGYDGDKWEVISLPALAEPPEDLELDDDELEQWRDELGRARGEALQGRYTRRYYEQRRASIDPFTFSALYQQRPSLTEGGMFPAGNWQFWNPQNVPLMMRRVRVWDLAATEGAGDWTVGSLFGLGSNGDLYLIERVRGRWNSADVERKVQTTAALDGTEVKVIIEQEKAGAGKREIEHYKRLLAGYMVEAGKIDGEKEVRARPYSAMQLNRRVWLPEHEPVLCKEWIDEHKRMMGDGRRPRHDDQIDTGAYATIDLIGLGITEMWVPGEDERRDVA